MLDFLVGKNTMKYTFLIVLCFCVLLLLISLVKYDKKHTILKTLGFFLLTGVTVFSGIMSYQYISAKGGIYGSPTTSDKMNQAEVTDLTFNLKNVMMKNTDTPNEYEANFELNQTLPLEDDEKYVCSINDLPCVISTYSHSYFVADYTYTFYNDDFENILTDTLTMKIFVWKYSTELIVTTSGGQQAVDCWNAYFNKFDFIFKIETDENAYVAKDSHKIELLVDGEIYNTVSVLTGHDFIPPTKIETSSDKYFTGKWFLNGTTPAIIKNIDSDLVLEADMREYRNVQFYDANKIPLESKQSPDGLVIDPEIIPEMIETPGNRFKGWTTDFKSVLNLETFILSADIELYAWFEECTSYNLSYELGGGKFDQTQPLYANYGSVFEVPVPIRTGYYFNGWTIVGCSDGDPHYHGSESIYGKFAYGTAIICDSDDKFFSNLSSVDGADVTFYAEWKVITYKVVVDYNGGSSSFSAPTSAEYNSTFTLVDPVRSGYTFVGWEISGMDETTHYLFNSSTNESAIIREPTYQTNKSDKNFDKFQNLTSINGVTVTLKALWEANQ